MRLRIIIGTHSDDAYAGRERIEAPRAAILPFRYPLAVDLPSGPAALHVADLHEAFVNQQTANTRLVTTQALFLVQSWLDAIGDRDVVIVATADRDSLATHAPEVLQKRGVFQTAVIDEDRPGLKPWPSVRDADQTGVEPWPSVREDAGGTEGEGFPALSERSIGRVEGSPGHQEVSPGHLLARAMRVGDPRERLALCIEALDAGRTPAALVTTASVCMEVNDLDAAERDLEDAIQQAPEWAAAHFERGKLWLRRDDMERAADAFQAAAERMPRFSPAWSNLGATLGELDRPDEALEAFGRALACDPTSHQTLNNIGVVRRELGQLPESEAAFRQVIQRVPDLAFGHYNLGHTLFLQGRYQGALAAYAAGQQRDPERNPVQATRLALCRLATGDAAGAIAELERATRALPREYRQQLLADTDSIAWALLTHRPDLPGWQQVHDWLARELAK